MRSSFAGRTAIAWFLFSTALVALAAAQEAKYKTFDDAFHAGSGLVRGNQHAAGVEALDAALKLATDDAQRLKAYQAAIPAYRTLPEIDKMLAAQDFVIRHTRRKSGRSVTGHDVASFLYQRGKTEAGVERYEAQLKESPGDLAALNVLVAIYKGPKYNRQRAAELDKQLDQIDRKLARELAQRLEQEAAADPNLAASQLKDAAAVWLEAGEKDLALAAAKKSASSPPEKRSDLLVYYWHDGLGDVFLKTGEPQLAVAEFEAAVAAIGVPSLRQSAEKKLAQARSDAAK